MTSHSSKLPFIKTITVRALQKLSRHVKQRLPLIIYLLVYTCFLTLNLGYMSIQWDEIPHLYGGLLLFRGQPFEYVATYGYYPPLYDLLTTMFFYIFGIGVASGRLVSVMFSLLSLWILYEFTSRIYNKQTALLASVFLGVMPGFFWLSRIAMLETALVFFFTLALFFFFSWMRFSQNKALRLCGLTLGAGFLAKYQILVAVVIMFIAVLVFYRKKLRSSLSKFLLLPLIAVLVTVPWILILYQLNGLGKLGEFLYVIQEGGQDRALYSSRFFQPIFYLVEMTWPFSDIPVHPISLPLYILGLLGIVFWAFRRRTEDNFFLLWFIVVYVFFTLVPNKQWRYVIPVFPVLAVSAACFISFIYSKIRASRDSTRSTVSYNRGRQIAAVLFSILVASCVFYSCYDAYQMTIRDQIHISIEEVAHYVSNRTNSNESIVLLCAWNLFNQDMLRFYLPTHMSKEQVWQYPALPVDSFTLTFNLTEFIYLCETRNAKWIVMYEYGPDTQFFNSTLTMGDLMTLLGDSGRFAQIADEPWNGFGSYPHRVFVFGFLRTS